MWNGLSMWRLLLRLAWMWETNKSDGFGDKVEGGRDDSVPKLCSVSSYIIKWSFISGDHQAPYWCNGLPCGTWSWPILTMLSLGYQNLISFRNRVVDFQLTYSGNLYSQGAISFVWVLIFRKYDVWGWLELCTFMSCQVCCRASCSSCAYRYVVQISTTATKYILNSFLLEGPQIPLLSLPDTTLYSFSSIAGTLSSISSWWIVIMVFSSPSPDVHES
jgi:hypothetical protein